MIPCAAAAEAEQRELFTQSGGPEGARAGPVLCVDTRTRTGETDR